jgi:2-polyprenyl-6-methoxyphenol hydroxylase-like FAD-dependent oxidoreductase
MLKLDTPFYDVVIAGAGPVGLFLACELRLAGLSVLALEQAEHPQSSLKQLPFGMRGLSLTTLEAFDRRGLLDEVVAAQRASDASGVGITGSAHWLQQPRRAAGHFAGIQFFHDQIDTARWAYYLPSPAGTGLAVAMETLETVLAARASAMGAEIRRGCAVKQLEQSADGVTIRAGNETARARWLVGCDGGRSTIRKLAGFEFVGTDPEFTGYSIDMELADLDSLPRGRHYTATGMYTFTPPSMIAMVEFDRGAFHRTDDVTLDHVQAVLRRVSGAEVSLTALHLATTWTDRAFQATSYRKDRVLLAGDAAHIHSPLGGQGLNLGLGDAINLGWKLAAVMRDGAPDALLDTYTGERHPVGAQILDWSRAQVALMRPTPSTRALEAIIRDLVETGDGATYFAERVWGVALHYDLGSDHPLVGRSVPDFKLANGGRVGELLREGKALFLDFATGSPLAALAPCWGERISYIPADVEDRLGLSAALVRPDGIVAWASDAVPDVEQVSWAASQWLGESTTAMPN